MIKHEIAEIRYQNKVVGTQFRNILTCDSCSYFMGLEEKFTRYERLGWYSLEYTKKVKTENWIEPERMTTYSKEFCCLKCLQKWVKNEKS